MSLTKIEKWQRLGFGMFIHYGLYSLCGGVWNGKPVIKGYSEQILSHGNIPKEQYKAMQHKFLCEAFNAEKICHLAKKAGMNYIVITAKHHDGFCLFNTKTTSYNSVNAPAKKDIVAELSKACKKNGLKFGVYFSWIDWDYPHALPISSHNSDLIPPLHHSFNLAQLKELFTNYGSLCELWLDMGQPTEEQSDEVKGLAYALQPNMMINGRIWNDKGDFCTMADNQFPDKCLNVPWQTPASIYHETWGYRSWQKRENIDQKISFFIESLIRVKAAGGNYLLNIGPKGDGSLVEFEENVLKGIGEFFDSKAPSKAKAKMLCKKLNLKINKEIISFLNKRKHEFYFTKKLYRFTGKDYYSSKFICTELNINLKCAASLERQNLWNIILVRNYQTVQDEYLMINGKKICFPAGKDSVTIFDKLKIEKIFTISLSSLGEPALRKEIKHDDIKIVLENVFEGV